MQSSSQRQRALPPHAAALLANIHAKHNQLHIVKPTHGHVDESTSAKPTRGRRQAASRARTSAQRRPSATEQPDPLRLAELDLQSHECVLHRVAVWMDDEASSGSDSDEASTHSDQPTAVAAVVAPLPAWAQLAAHIDAHTLQQVQQQMADAQAALQSHTRAHEAQALAAPAGPTATALDCESSLSVDVDMTVAADSAAAVPPAIDVPAAAVAPLDAKTIAAARAERKRRLKEAADQRMKELLRKDAARAFDEAQRAKMNCHKRVNGEKQRMEQLLQGLHLPAQAVKLGSAAASASAASASARALGASSLNLSASSSAIGLPPKHQLMSQSNNKSRFGAAAQKHMTSSVGHAAATSASSRHTSPQPTQRSLFLAANPRALKGYKASELVRVMRSRLAADETEAGIDFSAVIAAREQQERDRAAMSSDELEAAYAADAQKHCADLQRCKAHYSEALRAHSSWSATRHTSALLRPTHGVDETAAEAPAEEEVIGEWFSAELEEGESFMACERREWNWIERTHASIARAAAAPGAAALVANIVTQHQQQRQRSLSPGTRSPSPSTPMTASRLNPLYLPQRATSSVHAPHTQSSHGSGKSVHSGIGGAGATASAASASQNRPMSQRQTQMAVAVAHALAKKGVASPSSGAASPQLTAVATPSSAVTRDSPLLLQRKPATRPLIDGVHSQNARVLEGMVQRTIDAQGFSAHPRRPKATQLSVSPTNKSTKNRPAEHSHDALGCAPPQFLVSDTCVCCVLVAAFVFDFVQCVDEDQGARVCRGCRAQKCADARRTKVSDTQTQEGQRCRHEFARTDAHASLCLAYLFCCLIFFSTPRRLCAPMLLDAVQMALKQLGMDARASPAHSALQSDDGHANEAPVASSADAPHASASDTPLSQSVLAVQRASTAAARLRISMQTASPQSIAPALIPPANFPSPGALLSSALVSPPPAALASSYGSFAMLPPSAAARLSSALPHGAGRPSALNSLTARSMAAGGADTPPPAHAANGLETPPVHARHLHLRCPDTSGSARDTGGDTQNDRNDHETTLPMPLFRITHAAAPQPSIAAVAAAVPSNGTIAEVDTNDLVAASVAVVSPPSKRQRTAGGSGSEAHLSGASADTQNSFKRRRRKTTGHSALP